MQKLKIYLNGMPPPQQAAFAQRCGTTIGYLRKAISTGQQIGEGICIAIERESGRQVLCEDVRPDVDWAYLRGSNVACATTAPAAINSVAPRAERRVSTTPNPFPDLDRRAAVQGAA